MPSSQPENGARMLSMNPLSTKPKQKSNCGIMRIFDGDTVIGKLLLPKAQYLLLFISHGTFCM